MAAVKDKRLPRDISFTQRILKSGVKFAAGSDMCWFYPGKTRGPTITLMFGALHDAGMPPLDIIPAATTNAAELLGWQDRVGAVEPGKIGSCCRRWRSDLRHQRAGARSTILTGEFMDRGKNARICKTLAVFCAYPL